MGSYQQSWILIHKLLDWIEPGFYYKDPAIVSMYQLTQATRKLAHVVVYAILTLLVVRFAQAGRTQLRARSLLIAVLVSGAFLGIEVYLRRYQSEGTRHVRAEQFVLDGIGVASVLVGTVLFFLQKSLERWILRESNPVPQEAIATLPKEPENG
jgi:VanZ family protein